MNVFLSTLQNTFIIISAVIVGILIISLVVVLVRRSVTEKRYHELYYQRIYKTALYKDYYLINNFTYLSDDSLYVTINHILFGDKCIYLILDMYYYGDLYGTEDDLSLILVPHNQKKCYTENPLGLISKYLEDIKRTMGLDDINMRGLVVVNNDCYSEVTDTHPELDIVRVRRLKKYVDSIEKDESIPKIDSTQLKNIVDKFDATNIKKEQTNG
ncbi:MAG: hypothetical protein LUC31_00035 [Coprobacillus sp.]|nr:hypothetical protein [Coprobacillus sp.]